MSIRGSVSAVVLVFAGMFVCGCWKQIGAQRGPATSGTAKPVSVDDIRRGVIGELGGPLGTVVEVRGKVIANHSGMKTYAGEPFFLQVEQVNGKALDPLAVFRGSDLSSDLARSLKPGDSFDYMAYESGSYGGVPHDAFKYEDPVATEGFHFATHLMILSAPPHRSGN